MEFDLDKILQIFAAESEEHLGAMEEALVGLESNSQDDRLLEAIFRAAHTIKGNAASLQFPNLAGFAHGFEEILQRMRGGTLPVDRSQITLLLRGIDTLRQLVPNAIAGCDELAPDQMDLLSELNSGAKTASSETAESTFRNMGTGSAWGRSAERQRASDHNGTIRVDKTKLDRMLDLAGEITIAQGRFGQVRNRQSVADREAWEAYEHVERLTQSLQEEILQLRMLPLEPTFRYYLRLVRDLAQSQGKAARLELDGEDVEVDVSVIEHLRDPLMHMIRNAIDHGIESPDQRRAIGKDPCGRLLLKARHEGNNIVIQIVDDGAGLNRDCIVKRAREMNLLSREEELTDAEVFRLIFEAGFSTAKAVTELSGRGVGMDVVRRNIEALRGSISIDSKQDHGTTINIRLPLTLAIIEGFAVGVGNDTYVLPLYSVAECVPMPVGQTARVSQGIIEVRGEPLPFVRLRDWFRLPGPRPERETIVVVEVDGSRAGLAVDALYGARQTVIKPLGKQFQSLPCITGSAILGSGRVALILDATALVRSVVRAPMVAPSQSQATFAQEFLAPTLTECR